MLKWKGLIVNMLYTQFHKKILSFSGIYIQKYIFFIKIGFICKNRRSLLNFQKHQRLICK
uniref:Uncharacterized protein n=1 Tax=Arundo donax TaxID=35708 RepID=A0A0A9DHI0_ARUDO